MNAEHGPQKLSWGRYSLLVKLNLTIGVSFLLTMALFLFLSYRTETSFLVDHSVRLLNSMLAVITATLPEGLPQGFDEIEKLQQRLDATGVHRHLLLVVGADGRVIRSADGGQVGKRFAELFPRVVTTRMPQGAALVSSGAAWWLRVHRPAAGGNDLYLLLHWGHTDSSLRAFLTIHGIHVLATLAVFFLLLWLVTDRFVRRRLLDLLRTIRRLEMGRWDSDAGTPGRDELGWLQERFREMALKLKGNVDSLVRAEKYASAAIIALRVAREMTSPLAAMRRELRSMSSEDDMTQAQAVAIAGLDRSVRDLEGSLRRLTDIRHPSEWAV
jgi:HAMP domain-containing protein